MKTIIYHNPRCSKSREALQLLQQEQVDLEVREYLKEPPTRYELSDLLKLLGISAEELLRKNETIYKEQYKGKEYSNEEWITIMLEHPQLIERPIVLKNGKAVIGRPIEKVINLIN